MAKNKSQYDSTLNLPKTLFEMRAGLPKKEPVMLKDWEDNDLYNNLIKHNDGKPKFVLHDGPPYANGNIHMGNDNSGNDTWRFAGIVVKNRLLCIA